MKKTLRRKIDLKNKFSAKDSQKISLEPIDPRKKPPPLRIDMSPRNLDIDERWMEFKIINKNIPGRSYHVAAIHKTTLYIHGGYDVQKGTLSDFWKLQLQSSNQGFQWHRLNQYRKNYPGKLKGHSCICYKGKLVIFGGQITSDKNSNSIYVYHIQQDKWQLYQPGNDIPKLDSHNVFVIQDKMYVYGGYIVEQASYSQNFYELNLQTFKFTLYYKPDLKSVFPQSRSSFGMVEYKGDAWIFGGTNGTHTLNDLWKFNIKSKVWWKVVPKNIIPEPRRNLSMISYKNYFFIFGGIQDVTKQKNDIYLYNPDLNQWYKIHSSTNSIYQISPTLKQKRGLSTHKKTRSPTRKFDNMISLIPGQSRQNKTIKFQSADKGVDLMKRVIQESRYKKFLQRKSAMLKEFEISSKKLKRIFSPISQNMHKTLQIIGDQTHNLGFDFHQVMYDSTKKFILGKKPCARDAQAVASYGDKLLICGGDRHLMSFCDVFYFDLKKGLESKLVYVTNN